MTLLAWPAIDARAGYLATNAAVGTYTYAGGSFTPTRTVGSGSQDTGLISHGGVDSLGGTAAATAEGSTTPDAGFLMHAKSSATQTISNVNVAPYEPPGIGQGFSAWRDVAYAHSAIQPATLRLNFYAEGLLSGFRTSAYYGGGVRTSVGIVEANNAADVAKFFDVGNKTTDTNLSTSYFNALATLDSGTFSASATVWDSTTYDGLNFYGTFHVDLAYDSTLGGYAWAVALYATSLANGGSTQTNFLDTGGLVSVTTTDGTPVDVSFDSGLQFNTAAVPEPSSIILSGVAGMLGLGHAWRRRKVKASAQRAELGGRIGGGRRGHPDSSTRSMGSSQPSSSIGL